MLTDSSTERCRSDEDDRRITLTCARALLPTAKDSAWDDYQKLKAEQLKRGGPLSAKVSDELDGCEKQHAADVAATEQQLKERAAANAKFMQEQAERMKKEKLAAKALRASLKGDRGKVFDKYGSPTTWDGDIDTTNEWRWVLSKTRNGIEESCWTFVRFKGNKKVGERKEGIACGW